MPSIRHIAIMCKDPSAQAEFYKDVFELQEVWRHGPNVYMTDGLVSLVLLKAREGVKEGINHFGVHVEDMDEIKRRLELADVDAPYAKPSDGRYAELGAVDPEGNRFDLSVAGWETERSRPDS
jgi:catechol 2,3-dioxygenase-like lactoylglutathione lyase family enzyme